MWYLAEYEAASVDEPAADQGLSNATLGIQSCESKRIIVRASEDASLVSINAVEQVLLPRLIKPSAQQIVDRMACSAIPTEKYHERPIVEKPLRR